MPKEKNKTCGDCEFYPHGFCFTYNYEDGNFTMPVEKDTNACKNYLQAEVNSDDTDTRRKK